MKQNQIPATNSTATPPRRRAARLATLALGLSGLIAATPASAEFTGVTNGNFELDSSAYLVGTQYFQFVSAWVDSQTNGGYNAFLLNRNRTHEGDPASQWPAANTTMICEFADLGNGSGWIYQQIGTFESGMNGVQVDFDGIKRSGTGGPFNPITVEIWTASPSATTPADKVDISNLPGATRRSSQRFNEAAMGFTANPDQKHATTDALLFGAASVGDTIWLRLMATNGGTYAEGAIDNVVASLVGVPVVAGGAPYWAPEATGGGSGNWKSTSSVWAETAATQGSEAQSTDSTLVFGDAAGTVTVVGSVTVNKGLQFSTNNYVIVPDSGSDLIGLAGANAMVNTMTLDPGVTATIAVPITELPGSTGLTKAGAGTLVLGAVNTYIGETQVIGGTLDLASTGGLKFTLSNSGSTCIRGNATAAVNLNGAFTIDASAVTVTSDTWLLVDVGSVSATFGASFNMVGFTTADNITWTKRISTQKWTFVTSTGMLTLAVAIDDYAAWAGPSGYNLTGGPAADDDHDGLTNQQEYSFGLNPKSSASHNPITGQYNKSNGTFTYTRRATPETTGLSYAVWTSTDLTNWSNNTYLATEGTITTVGEVQTVPITLTIGGAVPTAPKLFVQVRATATP